MPVLAYDKQLLVNKLCNLYINDDVRDNIKSFLFMSARDWWIEQEAHRCKRLAISETKNCLEHFRSMDDLQWSHVLLYNKQPYQISDRQQHFNFYLEIGGANCEQCGNFYQLYSVPMEVLYDPDRLSDPNRQYKNVLCHCDVDVFDSDYVFDSDDEEEEQDYDF